MARGTVPPGFTTRAITWERTPGGHVQAVFPLVPFDGTQACAGDDRFTLERALLPDEMDDMRAVCGGCDWLARCRDFAIAHEQHYFYAGMHAAERDRVRREMRVRFVDRLQPDQYGLVV